MVKVLNREIGNRMWGGKSNVYGVSSGGTGGGDVDLSSYATMAWTKQNFVSIEYFRTLFKAFDSNDDEIVPNNTTSVVNNIKAMVGLWTEQYLTALGNQSGGGGGGGGAQYLNDLLDVQLTTPLTDGQALVYNATLQKWVNGAAGVNMTTVWNALAGSTNEQINASHLSTALSGYVTTSAISDMATQTWVGQQGFATQTWVTSNFITIAYFDRLFRAYNGSTLVSHNDTTSTIDNIKAMFGFWTDFYLSALGTGGVSSVSISLSQLADVVLSSPTNGQALVYDSATSKWVNGTITSGVSSLSALSDVTIATLQANQALIYNATAAKWQNTSLTTSLLSDIVLSSIQTNQVLIWDSTSAKWVNTSLKTINYQSIIGSGDISVGGGASGNYLPLTGGTLGGNLTISNPSDRSQLNLYNSSNIPNDLFFSVNGQIRWSLGCRASDEGYNIKFWSAYTSTFPLSIDYYRSVVFAEKISIGKQYYVDSEDEARATLSLISKTDLPCDFVLGTNNNRVWSFGCRETASGKTLTFYAYNVGFVGYFTLDRFFVTDHINVGTTYYMGDSDRDRAMLSVITSSNKPCDLILGSNGDHRWSITCRDTSDNYDVYFHSYIANRWIFQVSHSGYICSSGAVTALSDIRHKTIIRDAAVSVEDIARMPAVMYQWNDGREDKELHVGSIAQNWQTVLPEVVLKANDKQGTLSMQYGVAALVSSIIIARKVVNHEERIKQLEKENKELKKRLNIA